MDDEGAAIAALMGMTAQGHNIEKAIPKVAERSKKSRKADEISPSNNSFHVAKSQAAKKPRHKKGKGNTFTFPVPPRIVQVIKMPKTYVDHSYRDFSSVPPEPGHREPADISEMTFAQKLHDMLSQDEYSGCLAWLPHGRAFRIISPKMMEQTKLLHFYFGHNRYSGFLIQLKKYGVKLITKGRDCNCYYHEFLLRGLPHLCTYMPAFKECRRLAPDPDNEPDFYAISLLWPVPLKSPQAPVAAVTVAAAASKKSSEATHAISNEMLMSMFVPASDSEKPSALKSVGSILALPRAPPEAHSLLAGLLTTLPALQLSSLPARSNCEPTRAVSNDMLMSWLSSASQKPPALTSVQSLLDPPRAAPQAPSFVAGPSVANSAAAIIAAALTGRLPPQPQTVAAALTGRLPAQPPPHVATVGDAAVFRNPVQPQVQDTVAAGNAALIAAALQNPDWFRQYMGSGRM